MSFSIQVAGRINDVIEEIKAIEWVPTSPQAEATRSYVLAQLDEWPVNANSPKGVFVEASGHADNFARNVTLTIRPLYLRLPAGDA